MNATHNRHFRKKIQETQDIAGKIQDKYRMTGQAGIACIVLQF